MFFLFNSVNIVLCERYSLKMVICHDGNLSRESRVRVRVMVRVSVMTAYFFSYRSLACIGQ